MKGEQPTRSPVSIIRLFDYSIIGKARQGFTIVELLIVIAVIGVLGAIVTNAAAGAIRSARGKRADMMGVALEQAIAAYYAQEGKWPDAIEKKVDGGDMGDKDIYTFTPEETDSIFFDVVGKGFGKKGKKSVLVDATGLFVADRNKLGNDGRGCYDNHGNSKDKATFCGGRGCINGVDFTTAVARSGKHHVRFADMAFGFQGPEEGRFCRFWVTYNLKTDSVSVSRKGPDL